MTKEAKRIMKYDDLEINKVYQKTNMSDAEKKELLANCLNKRQQILSDNEKDMESVVNYEELSARRNEKMKKSEGKINILKTVLVASASIVATAAIVIGVVNYQGSKRTTTSKNTEKINTKDLGDVVQVFTSSYRGMEPIKIGDYEFNLTAEGVAFNRISEKEYTIIPDTLGVPGEMYSNDIYSDGEYAFYCSKQYLYIYKLSEKAVEKKVAAFELGGDGNYREDNRLGIGAIKNGYIYMNCHHDYEENIYVYNITRDEVKTINDKCLYVDLGEYMVCEELGSCKTDESIRHDAVGYSIWKYTDDGIEEIRSLASSKEKQPFNDIYFYKSKIGSNEEWPEYTWLLNDKLYIGIYEKDTEVTVYTFDIKTEEYKKVGVLKASDLGYKDGKQSVEIKSVYDDHYLVAIGNVDFETDELDGFNDGFVCYNYYFETGEYEVNKMN